MKKLIFSVKTKFTQDTSFRRTVIQTAAVLLFTAVEASAQSTNIGRGINQGWTEVQTWSYGLGGMGLLGSAAAGLFGEGGMKRHAGKGAVGSLVLLGVPSILNTLQGWAQ